MAKFIQDSTDKWSRRNILLSFTKSNNFIEFNSFTTNVKVSDSNEVGVPNTEVTLTAKTSISVYVHNTYRLLSTNASILTKTDVNEILNIVQPISSLFSLTINVVLTSDSSVRITIDPLTVSVEKLASIQSGSDLSKVQIKDAKGKQKPLIPSDVSPKARDSVAGSLMTLLKVKDELSAQRDIQEGSKTDKLPLLVTSSQTTLLFRQVSLSVPEALGKSIEIAAGDLFKFLKWPETDLKAMS